MLRQFAASTVFVWSLEFCFLGRVRTSWTSSVSLFSICFVLTQRKMHSEQVPANHLEFQLSRIERETRLSQMPHPPSTHTFSSRQVLALASSHVNRAILNKSSAEMPIMCWLVPFFCHELPEEGDKDERKIEELKHRINSVQRLSAFNKCSETSYTCAMDYLGLEDNLTPNWTEFRKLATLPITSVGVCVAGVQAAASVWAQN